jgi:polysaccharide chain length determinant protein (PEP-CTERM system associated)
MLPGKRYKPEDILQILRRRKAVVIIPFAIAVLATPLLSWLLTDRYQSSTTILVVPQRIPESFVKSTVTSTMEERLQSISQQLLSRTRLERIIQSFDLYAEERKTGLMEDVVEKMRKDIEVTSLPRSSAFQVSYTGYEPRTVMRVTERLASLFIEENLRDREVLVEGTNQFLETQLEDARRRLVETEGKLEEFRTKYAGELPSQAQTNLQVLQNLQLQLQAINESNNRDHDRRAILQRLLTDADAPAIDPTSAAAVAPAVAALPDPSNREPGALAAGRTIDQLEQSRLLLRQLELRLKPEHPDMVRLKRTIQELEKKSQEEALVTPLTPVTASAPRNNPQLDAAVVTVNAQRATRKRDLEAEIETLDRNIANTEALVKNINARIAGYQKRVEAVPERESEMVALTRDYSTLQAIYTGLLEKNENAKVAANLERRQIGEQFKILDPARLPEKPISPNRTQVNTFGILGGLVFGLALAGLLEYRDTTIRTDEDAIVSLSLPVVAMIPLMPTKAEMRTIRRRRLAYALTVGMAVMAWAGALVWKMT